MISRRRIVGYQFSGSISHLAALAHPDDIALWWRVAILEPSGRTVEVDTPSGWMLADWLAYADRYHGPECAVTPIAGLPKPLGTGQPR